MDSRMHMLGLFRNLRIYWIHRFIWLLYTLQNKNICVIYLCSVSPSKLLLPSIKFYQPICPRLQISHHLYLLYKYCAISYTKDFKKIEGFVAQFYVYKGSQKLNTWSNFYKSIWRRLFVQFFNYIVIVLDNLILIAWFKLIQVIEIKGNP